MSSRKGARYEANRSLVAILAAYVENHPDQRFSQILNNYGFVKRDSVDGNNYWKDEFYVEPDFILERVEDELEKAFGENT